MMWQVLDLAKRSVASFVLSGISFDHIAVLVLENIQVPSKPRILDALVFYQYDVL